MRQCVLLLLLMATLPASAARQITVDQLDQMLAASHGKSDEETARRLSDLELIARPSQPTLIRWQAELPGIKSQQALTILENTSAFLSLAPSEIPLDAAPDHQSQRSIMALTVDYVGRTIHQLPNLFATRTTTHFEDAPGGFGNGGMTFVPAQPLHLASRSSTTVVYRDGAEIADPSLTKAAKPRSSVHGLTTSGEFGPILVRVLVDAAKSTLVWSHWEPGTLGPIAVFTYAVPQQKSHYEVSYCCVPDQGDFDSRPFHQIVAYHGEIAVAPADGAVLRLTAQADLRPVDPIVRADIMVDYGPVEIGGKSYTCPLRSVAVSMGHALQAPAAAPFHASRVQTMQYAPGHLQTLLNEVSFTQYHLFHADTRLIAVAADSSSEPHDENSPNLGHSSAIASQPVASAPVTASSELATPPATETAGSDAAPALEPAIPTAGVATTAEMPSASSAEPDFSVPAPTGPANTQVPVFKANSQAVVVDIVVTKGKDEPVTGLNKQDFVVMEDGKPQPVDLFEEHGSESRPITPLPPMPPNVFTNQPAAPPGDSVNVLLLDSLNTPKEDQVYVHQQIMSFLKTMQPGTRIAIFALGSRLRYIQGFTDDPSLLRAALNDKTTGVKPDTTPASRTAQDDTADADHIKTMEVMMGGHKDAGIDAVEQAQHDLASYQTEKSVAITLEALRHLALYLAGIPGRKNLIWFSSTFPVTVFPSAKEKRAAGVQRLNDKAIRATADLLTLSKVAIYPVGAQGMMMNHTGDIQADMASVPSMQDFTDANNSRAGTIAAMEQLAADTGGEAILNTNDLNKALAHAVDNGSHYYTVVYTPTNKATDGTYRRIEIKLNQSRYKLAYRRGYYADQQNTATTPELEPSTDADPLRPMLAHGLPSATQLLYGLRVLPATSQPAADARRAGGNDQLTGPITRYSVDFMIRWTDVDLQPTPQGTQRGQIQLGLVAYGRDGKPVNWVGITQRMNLNDATFAAIRRSGIPAHLEIDLPQQDVSLVTGVYDWGSKRAGTLEVPVTFPLRQSASTAPELSPTKP